MNNSLVNQTLIEIEQNLKDLESARSQVNSVAKSSQDLVNSINILIRKYDQIEKGVVAERKDFNNRLEAELQAFQSSLTTNSTKAIKKATDLQNIQSTEIEKTVEKFAVELNTTQERISAISTIASNQSVDAINKQIKEINKTIENLKSLQSEVSKFKTQINILDIPSRFDSLRKFIETEFYEQNKRIAAVSTEVINQREALISVLHKFQKNLIIELSEENKKRFFELEEKQRENSSLIEKQVLSLKSSHKFTQILIIIIAMTVSACLYFLIKS